MSSQYQGKRALVTAANKGIGFTICQGLLERGFEVILAARSPSGCLLNSDISRNKENLTSD
jgi:NAD(P)-dependent dehydrogenase (short-subunit alcohol dehydrogenase family)